MPQRNHWEENYSSKSADQLGWYTPHLQTSLHWIKQLALAADTPIIDVGGGKSTLVDDLLNLGFRSISVLDLSENALSAVKTRLGKTCELVTWLCGDIITVNLPKQFYGLWHDRAVFHFLTDLEQQQIYRRKLHHALTPGGHFIIGAFAPEAPPKCSGLPVHRYSLDQLQEFMGKEFELMQQKKELHITPGGVEQMYLYCHFRKTG